MAHSPTLAVQGDSDLTLPWAEYVGRTGIGPGLVSLGWHNQSQAVLTMDVKFADVQAGATGNPIEGICQQILGFSYRKTSLGPPGTPGTIGRISPLRHPIYPNLVAQRISKIEFFGPSGKEFTSWDGIGPIMGWRNCRLTILFESIDYVTIDDDILIANYAGNELARYVSGPYYDFEKTGIQRQPQLGNGFLWPDSTGAFPAIQYPGGTRFLNIGVTQQIARIPITFIWRQVPEDSLFPAGAFPGSPSYPRNIFRPFGKVNDREWYGYPTYTLYYDKPKIEPTPSPFPLNSNFNLPQRCFDVTITVRYFGAPYLPTSVLTNQPVEPGWNGVPNPVDGQWYVITDGLGRTLYPAVNFYDYLFVSL